MKKVTVVLASEAPFCCPVWLEAAESEPQPRDKGLFLVKKSDCGQDGPEQEGSVSRGNMASKCQNRCLQDVTEFCEHLPSTCLFQLHSHD